VIKFITQLALESVGFVAIFVGLTLALSFMIFRNHSPGKRAFLTVTVTWSIWAALSVFVIGPNGLISATKMLPVAVAVWLILWVYFNHYWVEDTN